MNILLAFYNIQFAQQLKKSIEEKENMKVLEIISSEGDLLSAIENHEKVDGIITASDLAKKLDENRLDIFVDVLLHIRKTYPAIAITLMSSERPGHPMHAELVDMGLYNIFIKNEGSVSVDILLSSLSTPISFSEALKHKSDVDSSIPWRKTFTSESRLVVELKGHEKEIEKEKKTKEKKPKDQNDKAAEDNLSEKRKQEETVITNFLTLQRKIILIASPYNRAGSTFVAHQLAYQIARSGAGVQYFENPLKDPYTYDRVAGHLQAKNYISRFSNVPEFHKEEDYSRELRVDNVLIQALNPALEQPVTEDKFSTSHLLRLLLRANETPYLIIDLGAVVQKTLYDDLLEIASHILMVVDSDLPKLEQVEQRLQSNDGNWLRKVLTNPATTIVANRFVKGIEASLPAKSFMPVPEYDSETVFKSQLAGAFGFENKMEQQKQEEGFIQLLELVLDEQAFALYKKKRKKQAGFFTKFRTNKRVENTEEEGIKSE